MATFVATSLLGPYAEKCHPEKSWKLGLKHILLPAKSEPLPPCYQRVLIPLVSSWLVGE